MKSNNNLSEQRIAELLDKEAMLDALQAGGVSNWDWYGESLTEYFKAKKQEQEWLNVADEICAILGQHIEEPAGRGCGYGVGINGTEELVAYLKSALTLKADPAQNGEAV